MREGMRIRGLLCALAALLIALALAAGGQTAQADGRVSCAVTLRRHVSLAAAGAATARLSRTQGVAGTQLSLTGAHWPASAAVIVDAYVTVRGVAYRALENFTQGITAANGALAIQNFRAPAMDSCDLPPMGATGETVVFLVHTLDNHAQAPVTFTYLTPLGPQVTTMPIGQQLAPGEQITMTGARWEPAEQITITPAIAPWAPQSPEFARPTPQPLAAAAVSVVTDSAGAFTARLTAPDEPAETQVSFAVEGTGSRYGDVAMSSWGYIMLPKVYPSIHLAVSAVHPGGALTVTGDHWLPQQSGYIEYCRGEDPIPGIAGLRCEPSLTEQLGVFVADGSGHFTTHVILPANARYGSVTVQARDPSAPFGLIIYAQGQPLRIVPTWAEAHPRLTQLIAVAPYLAGSALALLALLVALAIALWRRQIRQPRRQAPA